MYNSAIRGYNKELFNGLDSRSYFATIHQKMKSDVEQMSDKEIISCNFKEWAGYLSSKYYIAPISVFETSVERTLSETKVKRVNPFRGHPYEKEYFEQISYRREELGFKPAATPPCAYLTGVPAELLGHYDDHRRRQQTPDEVTLRTAEYIRTCPLIRAVLAGHVHYSLVTRLNESAPQIITDVTDVRVIHVT